MSHPENTLKEIIYRQNKKIEGLEKIIFEIIISYKLADGVNPYNKSLQMKKLEEVRSI